MKKIIFYSLIFTILGIIPSSFVYAQRNSIDNLELSQAVDSKIEISWTSKEPSRSTVYFGTKEDELNWQVSNLDYKRRHEASLTGLRKDQDYYYKIVLRNRQGQTIESFVNYLDTSDMTYTSSPDFTSFQLKQVIDKAAYFKFRSNREVRYQLHYGKEADELNYRNSSRRFQYQHEILLTRNLEPNTKYYYRLEILDRYGNTRVRTSSFTTRSKDFDSIRILDLMPSHSQHGPSMPEKAVISFRTDILSTSEIRYGTDPSRLRSRVRINQDLSFNHYITLEDLKPDTTYYFKINLRSSLNSSSFTSPIYSFKTAPLSSDYLSQHWQDGDIVTYRRNNYLIFSNQKIPIYSREKLNNLSLEKEIKSIDGHYLDYYQELPGYHGVFHEGQVVREENSNTVYLISGSNKLAIANWQVFTYLNYQASDIEIASRSQLRAYSTKDTIYHSHEVTGNSYGAKYNNRLVKSPFSNTVYLIVNQQRLPIYSEQVFLDKGYSFSDVIEVRQSVLEKFSLGQIII